MTKAEFVDHVQLNPAWQGFGTAFGYDGWGWGVSRGAGKNNGTGYGCGASETAGTGCETGYGRGEGTGLCSGYCTGGIRV